MIFMFGTHTVHIHTVEITVPVMNMKGESQGVVVNANPLSLTFSNFTEISLSNIEITCWELTVQNTNVSQISQFLMSSVKVCSSLTISTTNTSSRFDSCEFHDGALSIEVCRVSVTMENYSYPD